MFDSRLGSAVPGDLEACRATRVVPVTLLRLCLSLMRYKRAHQVPTASQLIIHVSPRFQSHPPSQHQDARGLSVILSHWRRNTDGHGCFKLMHGTHNLFHPVNLTFKGSPNAICRARSVTQVSARFAPPPLPPLDDAGGGTPRRRRFSSTLRPLRALALAFWVIDTHQSICPSATVDPRISTSRADHDYESTCSASATSASSGALAGRAECGRQVPFCVFGASAVCTSRAEGDPRLLCITVPSVGGRRASAPLVERSVDVTWGAFVGRAPGQTANMNTNERSTSLSSRWTDRDDTVCILYPTPYCIYRTP